MDNVAHIYLNSFAVLVLVLTLRNYRQKFKYICCEEKVFIFFILSTIAILVIETALDNLWLQPGGAIRVLLYILQTIDFSLTIVIPMLWLYYCLFRIYHISSVSRRWRILIAVPAAVFTVFVIAALPGGVAFSINEHNQYERGAAFLLGFVLGSAYIAAALILIIAKYKTLNRDELFPYLLVPAIPITVGIIEGLAASPTGLMWVATSLVILEIQMLVLNNRTNIDHLTSLNNRMALDTYVRRTIHESQSGGKPLGLIMVDIDEFKNINDQYGHTEGDRALKITADILRECFAGKYFIARYGGDEFTVVMKDCSAEMMEEYLDKLDAEQAKRNESINKPYQIVLSIGASVFEERDITDAHTMLMRVDKMMYEDKNAKRRRMDSAAK